jgi:hypothetical protein
MNRKTTLERAYELAEEGYPTAHIRTLIVREGYDVRQLQGRTISAELSKRILVATGKTSKELLRNNRSKPT